jgi:hypothetical protein
MNKFKLREVNIKPFVNKSNKQINFSIPKKKISKELASKLSTGKSIKLLFEDD